MVVAVAEKIAAMTTKELLAARRARADLAEFDRIMSRAGGASPVAEDELPADLPDLRPRAK